ncbi:MULTISPECIES: hypothetical protein [Rhodomicrobium]|uniref:hypothetical protein n=1 Tax=Rhodomicrobium TaxID=1068 RepID=UPI000B4B2D41|nr:MULTISPECIES: hypothetical protein [Rhodomicrobium]
MAPADHSDLSDETLVAFIDEALSPTERRRTADALSRNAEARARLERLRRGGRPFGEAFDALLQAAPEHRLHAMFADLMAKRGETATVGFGGNVAPMRRRARSGGSSAWQMAAAAAVVALAFAGGLQTAGYFGTARQIAEQKPGWREAASRYVALFSKETLEGMPRDQQARQANLQRAAQVLGLPLSDERIANPALDFQGTQILQLDGKPLAQISYLFDGRTPVALCIIRTANAPQTAQIEERHGLNIVHWVKGGYGFMVIGDIPGPELERISRTFRAQFS